MQAYELASSTPVPQARATAELLRRFDRPGPRYTSYPTAVEFDVGVGATDYASALRSSSRRIDDPFSLYLHLPFCRHRCLYCACTAIISPHHEKVSDPYLRRLHREIDQVAALMGERRKVAQLHLGGGTPTYHTPEELDVLLGHLETVFTFLPGSERSVEADPRVTHPGYLEMFAGHGFDRISFGVQDFDPEVQEMVQRIQSFDETSELVRRSRETGFRSVNVDLIYGLPGQNLETFRVTLEKVLEMSPDRLAVYGFAHVPWMKPHQKRLPVDRLPGPDLRYALLALAREVFLGAGYVDIGIDHFARPDDELAVARRTGRLNRNFMGYTVTPTEEILGLGVSSIGYVDGGYFQNDRNLAHWSRAIDEGRFPTERGVLLDADDHLRAWVIRSLMCHFEVDKVEAGRRAGASFDSYFAGALAGLASWRELGWIREDGQRLEIVGDGRLFVRNVAMLFDRYRQAAPAGASERFSRTV